MSVIKLCKLVSAMEIAGFPNGKKLYYDSLKVTIDAAIKKHFAAKGLDRWEVSVYYWPSLKFEVMYRDCDFVHIFRIRLKYFAGGLITNDYSLNIDSSTGNDVEEMKNALLDVLKDETIFSEMNAKD